MSRQIPLDELNKLIEDKAKEYLDAANYSAGDPDKPDEYKICLAKAEALEDLQDVINEPRPIQDVSENLQQTFNVEETKKIINKDELH